MKFVEIKNYCIAIDKVRYIQLDNDEDYCILFQFDTDDNFLVIHFEGAGEYEYWLDYLRKKINF